jgi:hypothetical protein
MVGLVTGVERATDLIGGRFGGSGVRDKRSGTKSWKVCIGSLPLSNRKRTRGTVAAWRSTRGRETCKRGQGGVMVLPKKMNPDERDR